MKVENRGDEKRKMYCGVIREMKERERESGHRCRTTERQKEEVGKKESERKRGGREEADESHKAV